MDSDTEELLVYEAYRAQFDFWRLVSGILLLRDHIQTRSDEQPDREAVRVTDVIGYLNRVLELEGRFDRLPTQAEVLNRLAVLSDVEKPTTPADIRLALFKDVRVAERSPDTPLDEQGIAQQETGT